MIFANCTNQEIIYTKFKSRRIKYAFHDIDGTHSLIREWPPVMSAVLYDVIANGLPENFDSKENLERLIRFCNTEKLPEMDDFCIKSAGLSALTQMEWAIRRAIENGTVQVHCDMEDNSHKIKEIYHGNELFGDNTDSEALKVLLTEYTPRLFRFYEAVLNGYCRDNNLAKAKSNPKAFIISGSMEFMKYLADNGVENYFVTGAVVEKGMGMHEEVEVLGYIGGENSFVKEVIGSTWNDKVPKNIIMQRLLQKLGASGEEVLVIGDGRSEIVAGVEMGAVTISRLDKDATVQRDIHQKIGTNIIVEDFTDIALKSILMEEMAIGD